MDSPKGVKKKKSRLTPTLHIPSDFWSRLNPAWNNRSQLPGFIGILAHAIPGNQAVLRLSIPALPMSTNARWLKGRFGMIPHPDAKVYAKMVEMACSAHRDMLIQYFSRPFGVMLVLESSKWLHASGKTRAMDVDNRIKSAMDALVQAVGLDCDENCWDIHAFKLPSSEERTTFYIYEREIPYGDK